MNTKMLRLLAALLTALLLAVLAPTALMEAPGDEPVDSLDSSAAPALEGDAAFVGDVDPEVELAQDAGDTGLMIEYEQAPAEDIVADGEGYYDDGALIELGDGNALTTEGWDEVAAPDDEYAGELASAPLVGVGYAAVAQQAIVYADADMALAVGTFPEGAVVYVEAVERDGAMLRIRFDTDDARGWAQDILSGYVSAVDALGYTAQESEALVQALSSDGRTRRLDGVLIPCAVYASQDFGVLAEEASVGLGVTAHSQADIQAFVNANPAYRNQTNIYSVAAADEPYTIGKLSPVNQQSALNLVNQVRYIAGLNADVGLLPEQEDAMAAASLVLRLNGGLSHTPARPAALADPVYDALYQQGYNGAGHANIAMGYTTTGAILAYMADSDDSNIATVGHRRWIIYPRMTRTVFGANGRFSAMYAHDVAGTGEQTKVAWPAQEMPLQYFSASDPWSVSYGRVLDASKVRVTLVRVSDSKTWSFSQAGSDGYFNVENSYYGQTGCVIFRPNSLEGIADGERFNVTIADAASNEVTRYTVHFFNLDLSAANPMDALSVTAIKMPTGNEISWNAVAGATGYYVCRRTETGNYQIIADVNATSYSDANVFADLTYYYQVYAHNASVSSRSAVSVQAKPVPPESVALNASDTVTVYANATLQLMPVFMPSYASAELTWDSSKPKYATVDANGLVTPLKKGSTIISVRTDNGKSATVKVKVLSAPKPKKVLLSASGTIVMIPGQTLQLAAQVQPAEAPAAITWRSSKSGVANVDGGLVTALTEGRTTITARAVNGKKARVKIKVVDPNTPESVALNYRGTVTLKVGETLKLSAGILPNTAQTTLTWTSSKSKYATVDGDGNVTAIRKGKTTITVRTANGKKAKVKIKVVN